MFYKKLFVLDVFCFLTGLLDCEKLFISIFRFFCKIFFKIIYNKFVKKNRERELEENSFKQINNWLKIQVYECINVILDRNFNIVFFKIFIKDLIDVGSIFKQVQVQYKV